MKKPSRNVLSSIRTGIAGREYIVEGAGDACFIKGRNDCAAVGQVRAGYAAFVVRDTGLLFAPAALNGQGPLSDACCFPVVLKLVPGHQVSTNKIKSFDSLSIKKLVYANIK